MEGKFLSFPCCFLREKVPLKAPPDQNDRNVQTEPSREPLGSLGLFIEPSAYAPTAPTEAGYLFARLLAALDGLDSTSTSSVRSRTRRIGICGSSPSEAFHLFVPHAIQIILAAEYKKYPTTGNFLRHTIPQIGEYGKCGE